MSMDLLITVVVTLVSGGVCLGCIGALRRHHGRLAQTEPRCPRCGYPDVIASGEQRASAASLCTPGRPPEGPGPTHHRDVDVIRRSPDSPPLLVGQAFDRFQLHRAG